MTTNAAIGEMFEDIKESLKTIEKRLNVSEELGAKVDEERERKRQQSRQTIEQVLQQISQHLKNINQESSLIQNRIHNSEHRIILTMQTQNKKLSYLDKAKVKTRTVVWVFGVLFLFSISSVIANFYLFERIKTLKENSLKYEHIKSQGGISKEQLLQLDSLMHENS